MMLAFEVSVNDKVVCVAGLEEYGVITAILSWVRRRPDAEFSPGSEELEFSVGGLASAPKKEVGERLDWFKQKFSVGDDVRIRVVEVEAVSEPTRRKEIDPKQAERRERAHYARLKRKFEPRKNRRRRN